MKKCCLVALLLSVSSCDVLAKPKAPLQQIWSAFETSQGIFGADKQIAMDEERIYFVRPTSTGLGFF